MPDKFHITLVQSVVKNRPYAKIDGIYAGPTWRNNIGLQSGEKDIDAVYKMMTQLSERQEMCMVYGTAVHSKISNTDRTMKNFTEEPVHLITFDLDKYEGRYTHGDMSYKDAIKDADYFIENFLPPEFHHISFILRFSSSFKPDTKKFK